MAKPERMRLHYIGHFVKSIQVSSTHHITTEKEHLAKEQTI